MQDAEQAPTPEHAALAGLLRRKAELELALSASPRDPVLRHAYFDHLAGLAASHVGLCHAALPELGHPLYFRAATPDIGNLVKVFRDQELEVAMAATPRQILVIGAYAGYGAVWLARRFPEAAIACVEPMPSNFRLLALNTAPWPQIRALRMAAWHNQARLGVARRHAADWTVSLEDAGAEELVVPALAVPDLLAAFGWSHADYVLCDAAGAEAAVFADPQAGWLRHLDAALVETYPNFVPGADKLVAACFPPDQHEHRRLGEAELYLRRTPRRAYPARPATIRLLAETPELAPLEVHDIDPAPWGFFIFDGGSCQLHPPQPGLRPARAAFLRTLGGQTEFVATLHHAGSGGAVVFTLVVEREDGGEVARAERVLGPRERLAWSVPLPAPTGRHRIVLVTAMAAPAASNANAWARWLDPLLRA